MGAELIKGPLVAQVDTELRLQFRVGSLDNEPDLNQAVQIIRNGGFVACQMRGVFGIWLNGHNSSAVQEALLTKGSDLNKPLSTMMPSEDFLPLIDQESVHNQLRRFIQDTESFRLRLGSMSHVRAPIKPSEINNIPPTVVSNEGGRFYMHNLDPHGHEPMEKMIRLLNESGIKFVAVTSLNDHSKNEVEIHQYERAVEFCQEKGIMSLLLTDPTHVRRDVKGSFAIIDLEKCSAVRDGHVPIELLEKILEVELDKKDMKLTRHPRVDFSHLFESSLSPEELRSGIIEYLGG